MSRITDSDQLLATEMLLFTAEKVITDAYTHGRKVLTYEENEKLLRAKKDVSDLQAVIRERRGQ